MLGASGVHHPLLSEAVTQFQAQAFNELLPPSGPVRTVVMGKEDRAKIDQAERKSKIALVEIKTAPIVCAKIFVRCAPDQLPATTLMDHAKTRRLI